MFISRKYIGHIWTFNKLATIRRMSLESNTKSNRIAICHMRSTNDIERNRLQVTEIVQKAKDLNANVSLVVPPIPYRSLASMSFFLVCVFTRML